MFDILTTVVLVLSAAFEGWKLFRAVNSLAGLDQALKSLDPDTAAYIQVEALKSSTIVEIVICSVLLLLTAICIIRFIRWAIIGNIIYLAHNTTKDFLKTTNNGSGAPSKSKRSGSHSTGGMKITNSSDKPPLTEINFQNNHSE